MNPGGIIGAANRERVRNFFIRHIGATNRECAEALGLGVMSVGRHVKALRSEWQSPNWTRCPSTHCERSQECRSPSECSGTGAGRLEGYARTADAVTAAVLHNAASLARTSAR